MAQFTYKGKNPTGVLVKGVYEARDKEAVVMMLRNKGLFPISIEVSNKGERKKRLEKFKKISYKDLTILCKQFYTMTISGLTVITCIDLLKKQTENKKLSHILNTVYNNLQKGMGLSEAFKLHSDDLPVIFISMIEVGELSGNIDVALERLAINFAKENKVKQKVMTAVMYPLIIGIIAGLMVIFMLIFIVPKFLAIFANMNMELPLPTKILKFVSESIRTAEFWILLPFVLGILKYIQIKLMKSVKVKNFVNRTMLKLPLIGENYKKILATRFTRSLSILLKTGVPLLQSLEVVEKVVDNVLISEGLENVKDEVRRGASLSVSLEDIGIFPVMVMQMISIGEEAGSLDSVVETVADFYDEELDVSISKMVSMLEPIMIFFLAIIVGGIVISMMYPMFNMYKGMN